MQLWRPRQGQVWHGHGVSKRGAIRGQPNLWRMLRALVHGGSLVVHTGDVDYRDNHELLHAKL